MKTTALAAAGTMMFAACLMYSQTANPNWAFNYIPQPDGNATAIASGAAITFEPTAVGGNASVIFVVTNRSAGPGIITSIAVSGNSFQLTGLPILPASQEPNSELRFNLRFVPAVSGPAAGQLTIVSSGQTFTFRLDGNGTLADLRYELITDRGATVIRAGETAELPNTAVGERTAAVFRISNAGTAAAQITLISVTGTGFELSDVPALPATVAAGSLFTFEVVFTPRQPGRSTARLRIGDAVIDLTALALGPQLTFSYSTGSDAIPVANGGSVIFTPLAAGRTSTAMFIIANTGTAPATVSSIGVTSASNVFKLPDLPALPATLGPGQSQQFSIQFAPNNVGVLQSTLRIDTQSVTLSGLGTDPVPLPPYSFGGAEERVEPRQQLPVSVALEAPYGLTITGTLTLEHVSESGLSDPSVQFATGGRTVRFTIPASTTRAVFQNGSSEMRFQTGTTAGAITITPAFTIEDGPNLTPTAPRILSMLLPASPPRILSAQLAAAEQNNFALIITGYSTSRNVTQMSFDFAAVAGASVLTPRVVVPSEGPFNAWFQSQQSQQFGGQFTVQVPFSLSGSAGASPTLVQGLQSVAVTLTGAEGPSNTVSVPLR